MEAQGEQHQLSNQQLKVMDGQPIKGIVPANGGGLFNSEDQAIRRGSMVEKHSIPLGYNTGSLPGEILALGGRLKEGFIKKWVNYYRGFKNRYFVLTDELLLYYKSKNGQVSERGQISLKLARLDPKTMNDRKMIISTGTNQIHLEFSSI